MLTLGLFGYGYWGPKLARAAAASGLFSVEEVFDSNPERCRAAAEDFPLAAVSRAHNAKPTRKLDLAVVATPPATHTAVSHIALEHALDVLITKPAFLSGLEAGEFEQRARDRGARLWVDLTYLYSGGIRAMRDLIAQGYVGNVDYVVSQRSNLGLFQDDCSVIWDLAVHDFAILEFLTGQRPQWVSAVGQRHSEARQLSSAALTLGFGSSGLASLFVSWSSALKVRQIVVGGSSGTIEFDDIHARAKVKAVQATITSEEHELADRVVSYGLGEIFSPPQRTVEPLIQEFREIGQAIIDGGEENESWQVARDGILVAEAADLSIASGGVPKMLTWTA